MRLSRLQVTLILAQMKAGEQNPTLRGLGLPAPILSSFPLRRRLRQTKKPIIRTSNTKALQSLKLSADGERVFFQSQTALRIVMQEKYVCRKE